MAADGAGVVGHRPGTPRQDIFRGAGCCVPIPGVSEPIWAPGRQVLVTPGAAAVTICTFQVPAGKQAVVVWFGNDADEDVAWADPDPLRWTVRHGARALPYGWADFTDQRGQPYRPLPILWVEVTESGEAVTVEARLPAAAPQAVHASATLGGYTV